ncbi:hypothetical protein AT864_02840 [Anoxybacillus sp. P3H1B]|jgi:Domain of unknown function (DUF4083)|uniref:DUF4083 family protein n=1 Tax=Anoxybacillaceae TaxID=3120669 RepID=UPI00079119B5|nr:MULTISPECIES: DUF4083 family protein [Anoxybacillus]KXG08932.1 hypothetical protein AT864_02840 [Anoxybacillus sp. P3H1B]MBB3908134.1 hypothetical protein [Anoxybacillus rupiensis]QHC04121.1 DUF4083 domain-containing protein [Anoxybacillus sp. PDR2]
MQWGDLIFLLLMLALFAAFISAIFWATRSLLGRSRGSESQLTQIEEKLDRIIELLEKQRKK